MGSGIGTPMGLLWGCVVMLSVYVLLPIVLLSMIEKDSPFSLYSQDVIKSFERCKEEWGTFFFTSGILFTLYFLVLAGIPAAPITGMMFVGFVFFYARLLGRVVYATGISLGVNEAQPN